eukprot:4540689-Amphidinium_carterae.1
MAYTVQSLVADLHMPTVCLHDPHRADDAPQWRLWHSLFAHTPEICTLLLPVGDHGQLPPLSSFHSWPDPGRLPSRTPDPVRVHAHPVCISAPWCSTPIIVTTTDLDRCFGAQPVQLAQLTGFANAPLPAPLQVPTDRL